MFYGVSPESTVLKKRIALAAKYIHRYGPNTSCDMYLSTCANWMSEALSEDASDELAFQSVNGLCDVSATNNVTKAELPYDAMIDFALAALELTEPTLFPGINDLILEECRAISHIATRALLLASETGVKVDDITAFEAKKCIARANARASFLKMMPEVVDGCTLAEYYIGCGSDLADALAGRGLDYDYALEYWNSVRPLLPVASGIEVINQIEGINREIDDRLAKIEERRHGLTEATTARLELEAELYFIGKRLETIRRFATSHEKIVLCSYESDQLRDMLAEICSAIEQEVFKKIGGIALGAEEYAAFTTLLYRAYELDLDYFS